MISYEKVRPLIFKLQPEMAHSIIEGTLSFVGRWAPSLLSPLAKEYTFFDPRLSQNILGINFISPVGLAAGFDKNATMFRGLAALGFGFIEYGTVTPISQNGNPKPRLFRHVQQESIQNAMGFNNDGMDKISKRVQPYYPFVLPLIANIGKNKTTTPENAINDYMTLIERFSPLSDILVINISSPNTPGLRDLQNEEFIKNLFLECKKLTDKPIFLKISPDLETENAILLCDAAIKNGAKGIVATNTTMDYNLIPGINPVGGLSGKVLQEKSYFLFKEIAKEFFGKTILVSSGGISDAKEAYRRIKAGASLLEIYSSLIFKGPKLLKEIQEGVLDQMNKDGFHLLEDAIGSDWK